MKSRLHDPLALPSDRISIPEAAEIHKGRRELYMDPYCNMLIQDLSSGIVPLLRAGNKHLTCKLVPSDERFEHELINVLPTEDGSRYNLSEAFADSVQYVGKHIAYNGQCILEIVKSEDSDFRIHFESRWKFEDIMPHKALILPRWIIQLHPHENKEFPTQLIVAIPKRKCAIFQIPRRFGGPRGYIRLLRKLAISNPIKGSSQLIPFSPEATASHYDFITHHHMVEKASWKLTRPLAWHFRSYLGTTDICNEYYIKRRMLQFRRTQLIIRDSIIDKLKKTISAIGRSYGLDVRLEVEVPCTVSEIERVLQQWQRGEIGFDQLNSYLQ